MTAAADAGARLPLGINQQVRLRGIHQALAGGAASWSTFSHLIRVGFDIAGHLDPVALAAAVEAVTRRHDAFRTAFLADEVAQIVDDQAVVGLTVVDAAEAEPARSEFEAPMDLRCAPLARFLLVHHAADRWEFWIAVEHVVADAVAMQIVLGEISRFYASAVSGRPAPVLPVPVQNSEVGGIEREYLASEAARRDRQFWRGMLRCEDDAVDLVFPGAGEPDPERRNRTVRHGRTLPAECVAAVDGHPGLRHLTWSTLAAAALVQAVSRRTGNSVVPLLFPFHNRSRARLRTAVTFLARALPLRLTTPVGGGPREVVEHTERQILDGIQHGSFPMEKLCPGRRRPPGERPRLYLAVESTRTALELSGCAVSGRPTGADLPVLWGIATWFNADWPENHIVLCHPEGFLEPEESSALADEVAAQFQLLAAAFTDRPSE
jgi:hypothetical protein